MIEVRGLTKRYGSTVAVGNHVTCTVEEVGALRNQIIAEPGAGDLLLQLLEEPDWRHGERRTSSDDR